MRDLPPRGRLFLTFEGPHRNACSRREGGRACDGTNCVLRMSNCGKSVLGSIDRNDRLLFEQSEKTIHKIEDTDETLNR